MRTSSSSKQITQHIYNSYSNKRISRKQINISDIIPIAPIINTSDIHTSQYISSQQAINKSLNGNTGIVLPQGFKRENNNIILDIDLPKDLKRIDIDSRQYNQNQGFDTFSCVIPINRQFGKRLDGMRIRYGERLALRQDRQGNLNKLKKHVGNQKVIDQMKSKLSKTKITGQIQSYLYLADDSYYVSEGDKEFQYKNLLVQKENQIRQLERVIQSSRRKLKDLGYSDVNIPKYAFSQQKQMLFKMGQNLNNILKKYPQQKKSLDSGVQMFLDSQLSVQTLTTQILRYKSSRFDQFSQILLLLGDTLSKFFKDYPKLMDKVDGRVLTFINNQFMRTATNSTHRIIDIVQYVPQTIKVQDVYTYANSKQQSKRLSFHMRALIKVLLQQLLRIKAKTGIELQLDQAVFEMVKKQAGQVVNVEELLKVFQSVSRTEQVQKVVQKVIGAFVQLPVVRDIIVRQEIPVEMIQTQPFERIVNNIVQVPNPVFLKQQLLKVAKDIIQEVVIVPQIHQLPVQVIRQIPKIHVQKVIQQRYVDRQIVVPMPQKIIEKAVVNTQIQSIREQVMVKPDIQYHQTIKEVPVIIQKIVPLRQQVLKKVAKTQFIEKQVYKVQKEVKHVIQTQIEVHDRLVDVIVPVQNTKQVIKEVTREVQVPVYLKQIQQYAVQVDRIQQIGIPKIKIQKIQVQVPVPCIQEVLRQQTAIVQNFSYKEVIKPVDRIIQVPVQSHTENIIHVPVNLETPVILYKNQIIEVQRIFNHEVIREKPVNIVQQKIVQIQQYFQRIKPIEVIVEKIVEKIVQVPKVVYVQRIVQKIEVVPRVIDRIVKVDRIVQIPVEKIIQKVVIQEVQRIVQKPVIYQKIIQVQKPVTQFVRQQYPVQVIKQILKTDLKTETITDVRQIIQEKIVIQKEEVPRDRIVQKLIPLKQEVPKFIDRPQYIQVQVFKEVPLIKEKIVPVRTFEERPVQVIRHIEKLIPVREEITKLQQIQKKIEKIIIQERIKVVKDQIPYEVTKIQRVPQQIFIEVVKQVPRQVLISKQKVVQKQIRTVEQVPVYLEIQKPIYNEKIVELTQIVPKIVEVPHIIEVINNQFKEIPILYERLKEIQTIQEKPVITQNNRQDIVEQQVLLQKQVICQKIKKVMDRVQVIKTVAQRFESKQKTQVPIIVKQDRIVQVPLVVDQIVQKIILMPQVVQVLKYVHEVLQTDTLGGLAQGDIGQKQMNLRVLSGNLQGQINILLSNLRKMNGNPSNIEMIQKFLIDLRVYTSLPRIHEIIRQVQTKQYVHTNSLKEIPTSTRDDSLSKNLLIQSLIIELKRIQKQNPRIQFNLPDDILQVFFNNSINEDERNMNQHLRKYALSIHQMFRNNGSWNRQQEQFLNSFLAERFTILQQFKALSKSAQNSKVNLLRKNQKLKRENQQLMRWLQEVPLLVNDGKEEQVNSIIRQFGDKYLKKTTSTFINLTNSSKVGNTRIDDGQLNRLRRMQAELRHSRISDQQRIRQLQQQIQRLRIIQREHRGCQDSLKRLQHQLHLKYAQIQALQARMKDLSIVGGQKHVYSTTIGSPVIQSPRYHSRDTQSQGSQYGTNYQQYMFSSQGNVGEADGQQGNAYQQQNYKQATRRSMVQQSSSRIQSNTQIISSTSTNKGQMLGYNNNLGSVSSSNKYGSSSNVHHISSRPQYVTTVEQKEQIRRVSSKGLLSEPQGGSSYKHVTSSKITYGDQQGGLGQYKKMQVSGNQNYGKYMKGVDGKPQIPKYQR